MSLRYWGSGMVHLWSVLSQGWGELGVRVRESVLCLGFGSVWIKVKDLALSKVRSQSQVRVMDRYLVGLWAGIILWTGLWIIWSQSMVDYTVWDYTQI